MKNQANEVVYESESHGGGGGGFVDDFLIDDLLDFPEKEAEEKESLSDCSVELEIDEHGNSTVSGSCLDDAGLAVPDDLADLEWVSRFVDDPPLYPVVKEYSGVNYRKLVGSGSLPVQLKRAYNDVNPVIPAKPRTKRQPLGRVWSVGSSTTTSSSLSSSAIISTPVQFGFSKPVLKRQKIELKPKPAQLGDSTGRKCSHCQVQKTPQWRAGPEGAKTLCNACGVRFKSGRLYPEYRPACSPTFREDVHSNSHRKVLEMRKKKDVGSCS